MIPSSLSYWTLWISPSHNYKGLIAICIIKLFQEYEAIYLAKLTIQMMSPLQLERSLSVPPGTTGQKPLLLCVMLPLTCCCEVPFAPSAAGNLRLLGRRWLQLVCKPRSNFSLQYLDILFSHGWTFLCCCLHFHDILEKGPASASPSKTLSSLEKLSERLKAANAHDIIAALKIKAVALKESFAVHLKI